MLLSASRATPTPESAPPTAWFFIASETPSTLPLPSTPPRATLMAYNTLQHTCNKLQYTTAHCSTLRHTTTHYNTLQHTAPHSAALCNHLQHTATLCNTLQHTVTYCNTLQHAAQHCNTLSTLQHTLHTATHSTHCNTLHRTATLQNTASHSTTLQHHRMVLLQLQHTLQHIFYFFWFYAASQLALQLHQEWLQ